MIQIYPNYEQLSLAAATCFSERSQQSIAKHGYFSVVLSGGMTPKRTYELLAGPPFRDTITWENVYVFWGDERCVPPNDPNSNEHMAHQALLDHVPIPPTQVYPMRCLSDDDVCSAVVDYDIKIQTFFQGRTPQFDFVFLGLGENGHTASLFPRQGILNEKNKTVVPVFSAQQSRHRITMTASLINQGQYICFLVSGLQKAEILPQVLYGPHDPQSLPAQLIQPVKGELLWLVDQDAAACISPEKLSDLIDSRI